jgi:hypothetical protein
VGSPTLVQAAQACSFIEELEWCVACLDCPPRCRVAVRIAVSFVREQGVEHHVLGTLRPAISVGPNVQLERARLTLLGGSWILHARNKKHQQMIQLGEEEKRTTASRPSALVDRRDDRLQRAKGPSWS